MMGITCKWSAARDCCECNEPVCLRTLYGEGGEDDAEPDSERIDLFE